MVRLGVAYLTSGDLSSALTCAREGLDMTRKTGYRVWEIEALATLAQTHRARGERAQSVIHAREGLAICQETGYQLGVERVLAIAGERPAPTRSRSR